MPDAQLPKGHSTFRHLDLDRRHNLPAFIHQLSRDSVGGLLE